MATKDSDQTSEFIKRVQSLEDQGIVRSRQEIVNALNWNKSYMSQTMAGLKPVPAHVYRKFTEVYGSSETRLNKEVYTKQIEDLIETNKNLSQTVLNLSWRIQEIESQRQQAAGAAGHPFFDPRRGKTKNSDEQKGK